MVLQSFPREGIVLTSQRRNQDLRPVFVDLPEMPAVALDGAIDRAKSALLARQDAKGFWCGELQGDSILESEYILTRFILDQENDPHLPPLVPIANYLRSLQLPDGGWNMYPGGKPDLSGTVKAYFALKLMGDNPRAPHMQKAREVILGLGGAEKCNTFTKFFFACLGQISFDACPSIPPEIVLLPKWFYFNLYHVSAWTRTMILPLGIVTTFRYTRRKPLSRAQRIDEIYIDHQAANRLSAAAMGGLPQDWRDVFLCVDQFLKCYEHAPLPQLRTKALREAEKWLLEHLDGSEGLGAIFPPMVYILVVFRCLGYPDDHPRVKQAHKHLLDFFITENNATRIQPCLSPVWDTGIALHALAEAGMTQDDEPAKRATQWLLDKECKVVSDWGRNVANPKPGGWFFEFENPHYPDVDDTAMVAMSLKRLGGVPASAGMSRGLAFLFALQNEDGGWAAFDKTTDRPLLEKIPFADHNAMQDPSCPDITGRVLECLGHCGLTTDDAIVQRAIRYLIKEQDDDGSWWGRWGVNYVYGTWQVLCGLRAVGEDADRPYMRRAVAWLRSVQKSDGSFGESCDSYEDPSLKGQGESTASQTAWGTMGLLAVAGPDDPAVARGIQWLIDHQAADGAWEEHFYTGTGFPRVFYLKYHLYRLYFPLMALGRFRRMQEMNAIAKADR
jgi:squalene-hopene/tetraprenyl-beta-curcumene cyclase